MDNKTPQEETPPTPEHQGESIEVIPINRLAETLGFIETDELRQIRPQLVAAMLAQDKETVIQLATQYHTLGEEVVNQQQNEEFARAQIGLMVALALVRRDGGRRADYVEDLEDALTCAVAMSLDSEQFSIMKAIAATSYGEFDMKVTKIDTGGDSPDEYLRKRGIIE